MNSHIRETAVRGDKKFELTVNHPAHGEKGHRKRKRERRFFDTLKAAEAAQDAVKERYAAHGGMWAKMKPHEQADLLAVYGEALEMGTTARGLLDYFKAHSGSVKHRSMTLREMVNLTIQTKTTSRRRTRYVDQLKYTLNRFAEGREALPLNHVTPAMITGFLASQKGRGGGQAAGETLLGVITRLRTMFSLACKNNTYLESGANPMNAVELPYIDAQPPVILTPEQAEKLLWVCRQTDRQFLPYLVLGLFGGIRPEELEKLRWRDIHLDDGEIVIEEGVSKTRSRRCFEIEPVLVEWLKKECFTDVKLRKEHKWIYSQGGEPYKCSECGMLVEDCPASCAPTSDSHVAPGEYIFECEVKGDRLGRGEPTEKILRNVRQCIRRHRKRLCKRSGVSWSHDILRKTCASVLMAQYENETKVAAILGNSPKIIHKHYRGLLRRRDSERFQSMTPASVRNDPIPLPVGGSGKKSGVLI